MGEEDKSREEKLIEADPAERERMENSPGFKQYSAGFTVVPIEEKEFYLVDGDRLLDRAQLWFRYKQEAEKED